MGHAKKFSSHQSKIEKWIKKKYPFLLAPLILLLNTSCFHYQYITLDGDLRKSNQFVYETDTARVEYRFAGNSCRVEVGIFNKLNHPIYVDWKKSALILNGTRLSYWRDEATLEASTYGYTIHWSPTASSQYGETTGSIFKADQISFIPPRSMITVSPLQILGTFFPMPPESEKKKFGGNGSQSIQHTYAREKTPLTFRSYLTLSTTEDFRSPIVLDDEFWVSHITQTYAGPASAPVSNGNQFYLTDATDGGQVVAGLLLIGVIILAAVHGSAGPATP